MFAGTKRPSPSSYAERPKRARRAFNQHDAEEDDRFYKLHQLCCASYDFPYEYDNGSTAKYTTFSEFMYPNTTKTLKSHITIQSPLKYSYTQLFETTL